MGAEAWWEAAGLPMAQLEVRDRRSWDSARSPEPAEGSLLPRGPLRRCAESHAVPFLGPWPALLVGKTWAGRGQGPSRH